MEAEQVFVVLRRGGDLDDGDGKAVGGRGEDSWSQCHIVFIQELCTKNSWRCQSAQLGVNFKASHRQIQN